MACGAIDYSLNKKSKLSGKRKFFPFYILDIVIIIAFAVTTILRHYRMLFYIRIYVKSTIIATRERFEHDR